MPSRRPLLTWLVLSFALAFLLLAGLACGKKDKNPTAPITHEFPIPDGSWAITEIVTPQSVTCPITGDTLSTIMTVTSGNTTPTNIFPNCEWNVRGNQFAQVCSDTMRISDTCIWLETINGSGTKTATSFAITYTVTLRSQGSCGSDTMNCVALVRIAGTKVPTIAGLSVNPGHTFFETWIEERRLRALPKR